MAFLAFHDRVRAEKRKPVEVLLNRLHRNLPAEDGVALRAVAAELRAMNVGVAIRAVLAHVGENGLRVASGASHLFMHAAQRIARAVVIKFRDRANGRPTRVRVTILTRNIQWSVRTASRLPLCRRHACGGESEKAEEEKPAELEPWVNDCPQMS